uniref:Uncharacterized protein n=1 Tax=Rhizophora mucronata TaxID=61149 RepID=A0A2P2LSK6_RHIMU
MRKVDRYVMIKEEEEARTKQLKSRVDQERNLERISVMEEGRGKLCQLGAGLTSKPRLFWVT